MDRRRRNIRLRRRRETIATLTDGQLPESDIRCVEESETVSLPTPDFRPPTPRHDKGRRANASLSPHPSVVVTAEPVSGFTT